ncbi:MAG: hypothetical protein ACKPHU_19065, partial [Planctomycetaceae bacterium]
MAETADRGVEAVPTVSPAAVPPVSPVVAGATGAAASGGTVQPEFIGGLNSSGSQVRAAVDELRRSRVPVGAVFERATAGVSQQAKAATVDSLQPGSAELNRQAS